jgi:hypothetical protein
MKVTVFVAVGLKFPSDMRTVVRPEQLLHSPASTIVPRYIHFRSIYHPTDVTYWLTGNDITLALPFNLECFMAHHFRIKGEKTRTTEK